MKCKVSIVSAVFLLFSCTASQFGWKEGSTDEQKPVKQKMIEDFDPLTLDDDDIVVPIPERGIQTESAGRTRTVPLPTEEESSDEEMTQGFRVQLMATGDEAMAREMQRDAIFKFPEVDVYLTLDGSLYRLRIGDCLTRRDAELLREEAVRKRFHDCWIVPSMVYKKSKDSSIH